MVIPETKISDLQKQNLISTRAMNVCIFAGIKSVGQLLNVSKSDLQNLRNCGSKTLLELCALKLKYKDCSLLSSRKSTKGKNIDDDEIELQMALNRLERLAPQSKIQFESMIEWKYSSLNTRSKNTYPKFQNLEELIKDIYSSHKMNLMEKKNVGKRTCQEIERFINETRIYFEEITANIDTRDPTIAYTKFDHDVAVLGEKYPFLLTKECEDIVRHTTTNKCMPYLFIAHRYILRCEDRNVILFRDYYGINSEQRRNSLKELGERIGLSSERVRQLVVKGVSFPNSIVRGIEEYLNGYLKNVICGAEDIGKMVLKQQMLDMPANQLILLIGALTDSYSIIQFDENSKYYLVKKVLIKNVKIKNVLYKIKSFIELKNSTIRQLDILKYIKQGSGPYHPNIKELCKIYACYLQDNYNVTISQYRYVTIPPNSFNRSKAIESIMEEFGVPVSLNLIIDRYNSVYPDYQILSPANFKHYIQLNPNISSKGKTGIYVLRSWGENFTGTITSYLIHILKTFNEPIKLDCLVDFVMEQYPSTNKKSIYNLIIGDSKQRFVIFEDEFIGLNGMAFNSHKVKERNTYKKRSFESKFCDLREFVKLHKRFPFINTFDDEEKSLARWLQKVLKTSKDIPNNQGEMLKEFIENNKILPQNTREYKFLEMCDQIKIVIARSYALPSQSETPQEYTWFYTNLSKYKSYKDNRSKYFQSLLNYVKDYGFTFT